MFLLFIAVACLCVVSLGCFHCYSLSIRKCWGCCVSLFAVLFDLYCCLELNCRLLLYFCIVSLCVLVGLFLVPVVV